MASSEEGSPRLKEISGPSGDVERSKRKSLHSVMTTRSGAPTGAAEPSDSSQDSSDYDSSEDPLMALLPPRAKVVSPLAGSESSSPPQQEHIVSFYGKTMAAWVARHPSLLSVLQKPPGDPDGKPRDYEFMYHSKARSVQCSERDVNVKGALPPFSFMPYQCCPVADCPYGPRPDRLITQQLNQFNQGSFIRHWLANHLRRAFYAVCRYCAYATKLRDDLVGHFKKCHSEAGVTAARHLCNKHIVVVWLECAQVGSKPHYIDPHGIFVTITPDPGLPRHPEPFYPSWERDLPSGFFDGAKRDPQYVDWWNTDEHRFVASDSSMVRCKKWRFPALPCSGEPIGMDESRRSKGSRSGGGRDRSKRSRSLERRTSPPKQSGKRRKVTSGAGKSGTTREAFRPGGEHSKASKKAEDALLRRILAARQLRAVPLSPAKRPSASGVMDDPGRPGTSSASGHAVVESVGDLSSTAPVITGKGKASPSRSRVKSSARKTTVSLAKVDSPVAVEAKPSTDDFPSLPPPKGEKHLSHTPLPTLEVKLDRLPLDDRGRPVVKPPATSSPSVVVPLPRRSPRKRVRNSTTDGHPAGSSEPPDHKSSAPVSSGSRDSNVAQPSSHANPDVGSRSSPRPDEAAGGVNLFPCRPETSTFGSIKSDDPFLDLPTPVVPADYAGLMPEVHGYREAFALLMSNVRALSTRRESGKLDPVLDRKSFDEIHHSFGVLFKDLVEHQTRLRSLWQTLAEVNSTCYLAVRDVMQTYTYSAVAAWDDADKARAGLAQRDLTIADLSSKLKKFKAEAQARETELADLRASCEQLKETVDKSADTIRTLESRIASLAAGSSAEPQVSGTICSRQVASTPSDCSSAARTPPKVISPLRQSPASLSGIMVQSPKGTVSTAQGVERIVPVAKPPVVSPPPSVDALVERVHSLVKADIQEMLLALRRDMGIQGASTPTPTAAGTLPAFPGADLSSVTPSSHSLAVVPETPSLSVAGGDTTSTSWSFRSPPRLTREISPKPTHSQSACDVASKAEASDERLSKTV